jgi:hypothetical protein
VVVHHPVRARRRRRADRDAGWYLQASLLLFLIARFVMTYLLGIFRPTKLLFPWARSASCWPDRVFAQNMVGLIAVVGISLSLSLMFPTIYGVALQGLGKDTKFGAAGLVMAILGGALLPPVHGKIMDAVGAAEAFIVPGVCLAGVALYALFDLRTSRHTGPLVTEGAAHGPGTTAAAGDRTRAARGAGPMFVVIGEALVDLVGQRGSRTLVAHPGGARPTSRSASAGWGIP